MICREDEIALNITADREERNVRMKAFDPNYKLLEEMYQDEYYPDFLVDKVKEELQKVIDLLESGETDTEVVQETLDEAVCGVNDLQEEFDENDSEDRNGGTGVYCGSCGPHSGVVQHPD